MKKKETSADALIRNLESIIEYIESVTGNEPSNREIAKGRDISDRMIGKIRKRESIPTIDKVDEIAKFFRLPAWVLLLPSKIQPSLIMSSDLDILISSYISADEPGRKQILDTAKHEASRANGAEDNLEDYKEIFKEEDESSTGDP
ncbi:MAG: hypothetical protein KZQ94_16080 [Candidatus Thiodiazotropha sp. (ex Troendleina suluensis)]|nr:hypothetical protein [Candidatus Thiodiazotropha sp. (ex Troendleina suluensis)]